MRGRRPKPTTLKLIQGSNQPVNENEPIAEGTLDEPPSWLSKEAQESWRYAIEHAPIGMLRMIDRGVFAVWCVAEARFRQANAEVDRIGMMVRSPVQGQPMQSPYLAIANKQAQIMIKAAAELGFTPSTRARVSGGSEGGKRGGASNPFAQFRD